LAWAACLFTEGFDTADFTRPAAALRTRLTAPGCGYERQIRGGQSVTALPRCSDVDLLGDSERIVNLDAEVPDGALHFGVPKEKLNRPEVSGPPVNQSRLGSPQRVSAE
jgi:hypothetical protein